MRPSLARRVRLLASRSRILSSAMIWDSHRDYSLKLFLHSPFCASFCLFQAEDGIRDHCVTGVQTCPLPILRPLSVEDLTGLLQAALQDPQRGLGKEQLQAEPAAVDLIARAADGDARRALNMLELAAGLMEEIGRASCRERG